MKEARSKIHILASAKFWFVNAGAWLVVAATNTSAIYGDLVRAGREDSWLQVFAQYAPFYVPWFLLTPAIFLWVERFSLGRIPSGRSSWLRQLPSYLLLLGAWVLAYVPMVSMLYGWLFLGSPMRFWQAFRAIRLNSWVSDSVYFFSVLGIAIAWERTRAARRQARESALLAVENAELSARLADTRLQMLRSQLEPHFLFNALNSITALIRTGETEVAARAIALLSELLRYAVQAAEKDIVPLSEEIDFAEAYLGFQQLRHGDRLTCKIDVDSDVAARVDLPPLILQPLLENAIRHGVERLEGSSQVSLLIESRGDEVKIVVRNDPGMELSTSPGLGIGLSNVSERLAATYGRTIDLRLRSMHGGFETELLLPMATPEGVVR